MLSDDTSVATPGLFTGSQVIVKPGLSEWFVEMGAERRNQELRYGTSALFSYRNVTAVILQHLYKCKNEKKKDKMSLQTQKVMYKVMQARMDAWVHYI